MLTGIFEQAQLGGGEIRRRVHQVRLSKLKTGPDAPLWPQHSKASYSAV